MKKGFPGYFANNNDDLDKLWDECLFILDANVLLSLYRYSDSTRSDLLNVFNSLSARLWIPHQVAYEYLTNRLNVIGEQVKTYDDTIKKADALKKSLEHANQHPFVKTETLSTCDTTFTLLIDELTKNRLMHEKRISTDEIKDHLEILLDNRVGDEFSREQIEAALIDGKSRYDEKIPPGYCDAKKGGDSSLFLDRCRPYGDYIVWLQIIEKANTEKKSVIFVTGDVKDDWWVSFQGKTVSPQPLLVQEFLLKTGQPFYMYTPDRFLERASTFLKQETSQKTLNEIRDVREDEADSIIFDEALNINWPSFKKAEHIDNKPEQGRAFTTYWSNESSRSKELPATQWSSEHILADLNTERQILSSKGIELQAHLEIAESQRISLSKLMDRVISKPGAHSQGEIEDLSHEARYSEQRVVRIESEIAAIRERIWEITQNIKRLHSGTDLKN